MTVCAAARCGEGIIFCASDRMVTTGDIEFEQPTSKLVLLTSSIGILPSDEDATLHGEILEHLTVAVTERVRKDPTDWWLVKDVAELYLKCRNEAKLRRSEREYLFPLGLDRTTFLERQKIMDPAVVDQLTRDMVQYALPSMAAIVCGIDPRGTHIFVVHDNDVGNFDAVGSAAIGIGERHARAQFSRVGHTWQSPVHETLLATYMAKKRAEVAPGVGIETDMFMFGPSLGVSSPLSASALAKVDAEYKRIKRNEDRTQAVALKEMAKYVESIRTAPTAPQEAPSTQIESPKTTDEGATG